MSPVKTYPGPKTEAGIRMMLPYATECQESPEAGRGEDVPPLEPSEGTYSY